MARSLVVFDQQLFHGDDLNSLLSGVHDASASSSMQEERNGCSLRVSTGRAGLGLWFGSPWYPTRPDTWMVYHPKDWVEFHCIVPFSPFNLCPLFLLIHNSKTYKVFLVQFDLGPGSIRIKWFMIPNFFLAQYPNPKNPKYSVRVGRTFLTPLVFMLVKVMIRMKAITTKIGGAKRVGEVACAMDRGADYGRRITREKANIEQVSQLCEWEQILKWFQNPFCKLFYFTKHYGVRSIS